MKYHNNDKYTVNYVEILRYSLRLFFFNDHKIRYFGRIFFRILIKQGQQGHRSSEDIVEKAKRDVRHVSLLHLFHLNICLLIEKLSF